MKGFFTVSKEFLCCIKYTYLFGFFIFIIFRGHLFELLQQQQQLSSTLAPVVDDELICAVLFLLSSLYKRLFSLLFYSISPFRSVDEREREKMDSAFCDSIRQPRHNPPWQHEARNPKERNPNLIIKRTSMMISLLYRKYLSMIYRKCRYELEREILDTLLVIVSLLYVDDTRLAVSHSAVYSTVS